MRHPPSHLPKLAGGGGGGGAVGAGRGVGRRVGGRVLAAQGGGAARDPLLPHAYLKGVCVYGGMGV